MVAKADVVEIEIDGPGNECLQFRPLRRSIRGKFEWNRVREPQARVKAASEPPIYPGQRIGYDLAAGKLYVVDGLHDPEAAAVRERVEAKGYRLPPAREEFDCDAPTALYWLRRAVESGIARVVMGKLPEKIDGSPRKDFIFAPPETSQTDRLAAAIERQNELMGAMTQLLAKLAK